MVSYFVMDMDHPHATMGTLRYFVLNKPDDMASQFVSSHDIRLLGDIDFDFPEGIHAIGRLDKQSEGLLLLTTDKSITRLLFQGKVPHKRRYLVLVRGVVTAASIRRLEEGVEIPVKDGGVYVTKPCAAKMVSEPSIRFSSGYVIHERVPHSWLEIEMIEGKFHQVRKMMTAIGHTCKRLIRLSIEDIGLGDLQPGEIMELSQEDFFRRLHL